MIFNLRGATPPPIEDLREEACSELGEAGEVRRRISSLLPGVDWTDPAWGLYGGDGFTIEFNIDADGPIEHMMLHVRGGGDPISAIARLARPSGWAALDCSTSEFLDFDHPSQEGWEGFQRFRDKIMADRGDSGNARVVDRPTA